jgi:NAD(P)-dependent dehydrogenase (short-subunit alcohol dehydrogenase family)
MNNINYLDLKNKNVLITGAGGFLAQQHIAAVIENNGRVILVEKNKKKIIKLKARTKFFSDKVHLCQCDITSSNEVRKLLSKLKKKKIVIDVLINNASNDYSPQKININKNKITIENFNDQIWFDDINVGLYGAFLCIKFFGSDMASRKKGVILNIASDLSIIAPDNRLYNSTKKIKNVKPVTYSVVKHGIIGLTKYIASYWGSSNIRCNALAIGGISNNQPKKFIKKISQLIPMGRMAKKNEYKSIVAFLISDASSYMTGATVVSDGGRSII